MTRLYILFIAMGILAMSCGQSATTETVADGFVKIKGTLTNAADQEIYFGSFLDAAPTDTAMIDANGNFDLTVPVAITDYYKLFLNQKNMVVLVLSQEDKNVTITGDANNFIYDYTVEGSKASGDMRQFFIWNKEYIDQENELVKNINTATGEERKVLQNQKIEAKEAYNNKMKNFAMDNPTSPASLSMVSSLNPAEHMATYDLVLGRLATVIPDSKIYTDMVRDIGAYKKKLEAKAPGMPGVGDMAPDIVLGNPEGKTLKLSSMRGKYVLIDFWASWCGPCRRENPNVVRVYDKYKDQGFEILGVSLDKTKDKWVAAIAKDQLEWPHVSDLGGWKSSAAALYGVKSIPHTVLVDKEGKIIATKLRGAALEKKLEELMGPAS